VLAAVVGGDEQEKHEIDRLAVDRVEMAAGSVARTCRKAGRALRCGMRERETIAQTGRAQLLANLQGVEDRLRIEVQQSGSARCEILSNCSLLLARAAKITRFGSIRSARSMAIPSQGL